ncbi:MAG: hypothetical protein KAX16_00630, partial [Actinomycetia bacterium]|nr:hypothetical protein [Actinomycetes bacterium]
YANADAKATYLKDDYLEDKKKEDENGTFEIISYTFGKTAIVHEWTFDETGKTYKDVTEIDITSTFKGAEGDAADGTSEHTVHEKLYFIKAEHQWRILSLNNLSP